MGRLRNLLNQIVLRTGGAQIILVGYPRLFPTGGCSGGGNGISQERQVEINNATNVFLQKLSQTASEDPFVIWHDVSNLFEGHNVCGFTGPSLPFTSGHWINDLQTQGQGIGIGPVGFYSNNCPNSAEQLPSDPSVCTQSFHPNKDGYKAEADDLSVLLNQLESRETDFTKTYTIAHSQHLLLTAQDIGSLRVDPSAPLDSLRISAVWPNGYVNVGVTPPSGHRIGAPLSDLNGQNASYLVDSFSSPRPATGDWQIDLYGASSGQNQVTIRISRVLSPPSPPVTPLVTPVPTTATTVAQVEFPGLGSTYDDFAAHHRPPNDGSSPPYSKFDPVGLDRWAIDDVTPDTCSASANGCLRSLVLYFPNPISLDTARHEAEALLPGDTVVTSESTDYYLGNQNYPLAQCVYFRSSALSNRMTSSGGEGSIEYFTGTDLYVHNESIHFTPNAVTGAVISIGYPFCSPP